MAASCGENADLPCGDFLLLQEELKRRRLYDDRIIHNLNAAIPTKSLATGVDMGTTCKTVYEQLSKSLEERDKGILKCIKQSSDIVNELRIKREQNSEDAATLRALRKEQTKLRLLQNELRVDEIVRNQTLKVFYDRCRNFYTLPEKLDV